MKTRIKTYGQLYLVFLLYSMVSVLAKTAAQQETIFMTLVYMGMEFCLLGVYAVFWQQMLKKFSLTVAMCNKGITIIYSLFWSVLIFKEQITYWNLAGSVLVILGIWLVSSDE